MATVDDVGTAALTGFVSMVDKVMVSRCRCRESCAREKSTMGEIGCRGCEDCGLRLIVLAVEGGRA